MLQVSPSELLIIAGAAFIFLGPRGLFSATQEIRKILGGIAKVKQQTRDSVEDILGAVNLEAISKDVTAISEEIGQHNANVQPVPFKDPTQRMH